MENTYLSLPHRSVVSMYTRDQRTGQPTVKVTKSSGAAALKTVWLLLTTNAYKRRTVRLRTVKYGSPKGYKMNLHGVTPAGTFACRSKETILTRSGWLVLDFDKLSPNALANVLPALLHDKTLGPSIVLAFISPLGSGLKVWVRIDLKFEYEKCYDAIAMHLRNEHPEVAASLDTSGRNIARLCLLCHDPNAYLNPNYATAPAFPMPDEEWGNIFEESPNAFADTREVKLDMLERWVSAAEQILDFACDEPVWFRLGMAFATLGEKGRSYFHRLSKTCSSKYNEAECNKKFDACLKNNKGQIGLGTFYHFCKEAGIDITTPKQMPEVIEATTKAFAATPYFEDEMFEVLPTPLQDICQHFNLKRERDIALKSLTATLSACFPTLTGEYWGKTLNANQFLFVAGPSGTGKGSLETGRTLLWPYHQSLQTAWQAYKKAERAYERQLRESEQSNSSSHRTAATPTPPVAPTMRQLFIAVDNSVANVIKTLAENGEQGVFFDTEADTLSGNFKQDFGDYSPLLRKVSEHEPHMYERKTGESYELSRPAISVAVSGTPRQLQSLIQSVENGLFSRFWFYAYYQPHTFDNPFAPAKRALQQCLEKWADYVTTMINWVAHYSVRVELTEDQQQRFVSTWDSWLQEGIADFGDDTGSAMKRQARACFRLCMLLTLLRNYEPGVPLKSVLHCSEEDFQIALSIADVLRQHGLAVYQQLAPHIREAKTRTHNQEKGVQDERIRELFNQGYGPRPIGRKLNMHFSTVAGRIATMGLKRQ